MLNRLRFETAENRDPGYNLQVAAGGMQGHARKSSKRGDDGLNACFARQQRR
jgi:hypothetical protein